MNRGFQALLSSNSLWRPSQLQRTFPRTCTSSVPSSLLDHKEYVMMKANLAVKKDQLGPLDTVALHLLSRNDVKVDFEILKLNALALDCHKSIHPSQRGVKELMEKQKIKKGRYTVRDAEKIQSNFVSLCTFANVESNALKEELFPKVKTSEREFLLKRQLVGFYLQQDLPSGGSRLPVEVFGKLATLLFAGSFSEEEDSAILAWVDEHGPKDWTKLARSLGRHYPTAGANVHKRYTLLIQKQEKLVRGPFSLADVALLTQLVLSECPQAFEKSLFPAKDIALDVIAVNMKRTSESVYRCLVNTIHPTVRRYKEGTLDQDIRESLIGEAKKMGWTYRTQIDFGLLAARPEFIGHTRASLDALWNTLMDCTSQKVPGLPRIEVTVDEVEKYWKTSKRKKRSKDALEREKYSCMRQAAHKAAVRRLHKLSKDNPDLAICLARMNWTREDASVHRNLNCPCFSLLIGPWRSWKHLKCRTKERAPVLPGSNRVPIESLRTIVTRNKIFAISKSVEESILTAVDRNNVDQRQLKVVARAGKIPFSSHLQAANFEDTLVVRSCVLRAGYRRGHYSLSIFNSATLIKVGEIDLALVEVSTLQGDSGSKATSAKNCSELNFKDEAVLQKLEIADVVVAKNTIVIHLMFPREDELCSETWIWSINTENPVIEDLILQRVFMEPINRYKEETDLGLLAVNNRYLVRMGQVDDSCILQCFSREDLSVGTSLQTGLQGMIVLDQEGTKLNVEVQADFEYNRVRVREAKLCHGKGSVTIALGIELGVVDNDLGDMYRLMVQVIDIEKGELLVQQHFGLAESINTRLKVCWCGPQLVVAHKREMGNANAELRLFCWEKGNPGFHPTPAGIRIVNSLEHELTDVHVDLQEVILFMENLEFEENFYYIYSQGD